MQIDNEYFEQFKNGIEEVWAKKLVQEFATQNNLHVHGILKKDLEYPTFAFNTSTKKWGTWHSENRTLTLSHNLLKNYEWDAVVHTLKHEMAHMIVSDIWGCLDDSGKNHGELFCKACKIMGVDEKQRHSSTEKEKYRLPEKDSAASKIYKLFCLGESDHKAESEAAISKAYELMAKYNISLGDLPDEKRAFVFRPVGEIYTKVPEYVKKLARIISEYYFVKHIFITHEHNRYGKKGPGNKRYIEFYGEPHNVDIAEYVYHFLLIEGERQWKFFQQSEQYENRFEEDDDDDYFEYYHGRSRKNRKAVYSKVAFLSGFYAGFDGTLGERKKEIEDKIKNDNTPNKLPVLADDALLEEKYKDHYHPVSWNSSGGCGNGGGWREGKKVGANVRIRQGITRNNSQRNLITA